jgi:hypothetical protein
MKARLVFAAAIIGVLASACTTTRSDTAPSTDPRCLSRDRADLITCQQALDVARVQSGMGDISTAAAQLVPYHEDAGSPEILVWAVTYKGVRQYGAGPSPACQIGDWTVTIDAHSRTYVVEGTGRDQSPCSSSPGGTSTPLG